MMIESFLDALPKAEPHLRLVGSASVPTVLEPSRRHPGGPVPFSEEERAESYPEEKAGLLAEISVLR